MNNRIILALVLSVFLLCSAACSQAGSIWARRDKNMRDLYADDVARNIGDVLTIEITEKSKLVNKAEKKLSKTTNRSIDFDGGPTLGSGSKTFDRLMPEPLIPGFDFAAESSNTLNSKAESKDDRSFIDFITVVVIDILPNGNLVVIGTRNRNIAGDIQAIEVSGIVRPSDIAFDNTVKSERVANFCIVTRNKGVAEAFNSPGWLGRVLDIVWPF